MAYNFSWIISEIFIFLSTSFFVVLIGAAVPNFRKIGGFQFASFAELQISSVLHIFKQVLYHRLLPFFRRSIHISHFCDNLIFVVLAKICSLAYFLTCAFAGNFFRALPERIRYLSSIIDFFNCEANQDCITASVSLCKYVRINLVICFYNLFNHQYS